MMRSIPAAAALRCIVLTAVRGASASSAFVPTHPFLATMHQQRRSGYTPLHVAAKRGHVDDVRVMLAHDGYMAVDANTNEGYTALHLLCKEGHWSPHDEAPVLSITAALVANGTKVETAAPCGEHSVAFRGEERIS